MTRIIREKDMDLKSFSHYGIKGMKWGRRRYQNKDGSLTPAGKARYDYPHQSERQRSNNTTTKKSVSQMTDSELRKAIERKKLEADYAKYFTQKESMGKKAAKIVLNDIIIPESTRAGKAIFRKMLEGGLNNIGVKPISDKKK